MNIRRTIILTALALMVASGAMAGERSDIIKIPISFQVYDTTASQLIAADSAAGGYTFNDTVLYYSPPVGVSRDFNAINGQILLTVRDTSTATMLVADSVVFDLQTKIEDDSATTWWTLWSSTLAPLSAIGEANATISVPADSLPSCFDYYRIQIHYIAEEDSILSHCTLLGTSTLAPTEQLEAYLIFRD